MKIVGRMPSWACFWWWPLSSWRRTVQWLFHLSTFFSSVVRSYSALFCIYVELRIVVRDFGNFKKMKIVVGSWGIAKIIWLQFLYQIFVASVSISSVLFAPFFCFLYVWILDEDLTFGAVSTSNVQDSSMTVWHWRLLYCVCICVYCSAYGSSEHLGSVCSTHFVR